MKNSILAALLAAGLAFSAHADDKSDKDRKEKDLPPGLQKKDKLPPGIAKKRGALDEDRTRVVTNTVFVTNAVTTPPSAARAAKPANPPPALPMKAEVDKRSKAINALDNKAAARQAAFSAIAKETGVPFATIQAQHRQHENTGTAGLAIANVIAAKTKKPPGNYLRQHEDGKSWERIAADNGVTPEELDAKLARIEDAMRSAK